MKTRLIAVVIDRLHAGKRINLLASAEFAFLCFTEDGIESCIKCILSNFTDQTCWIVRDIKSILHCITFLKTSPRLIGIKVADKIPVLVFRANQFCLWLEQLFPAF